MNRRFCAKWVLFFFIFIAGCQSDTPETFNTPPPALTPISIQLQWFTQAQFAGYYVALDKGWYKEEGLDVTIFPGGPDIVAVDLVTSGARHFGTTLLADLLVSIGKGEQAISIAQIQQNNGLRLLTRAKDNIKTPDDFKGKKVGVWLGGWEVQFNALLAQQQIKEDELKISSQGYSMLPFLDGRLDVASAMIYNEYHMVLASGMSPEEIHVIDYAEYDLDFPGDVVFTSETFKNKNPDICLKLLRASFRGWEFAMNNIDEAVNIVLKYDTSGISSFESQRKMMVAITDLIRGDGSVPLGMTDSQAFERMQNLLVQYQLVKSPLAHERVYTTEFVKQLTD